MINKMKIKQLISPFYKIKYGLHSKGWIYVGKNTKILNSDNLIFEGNNQIAPYCVICPYGNGKIIFKGNVDIGMFSRITCLNKIQLGSNLMTGPNVFISDYNHLYEDINTPISSQGIDAGDNTITIDDDCWIGTNVVICGNVHIGKHVVIGAGSFVNKDIPSYCVAVGNPAKVVKKYNFERKKWEKV